MAYFTTLYSGSSGNCALIRSDDKYLLIDMGKSCRTTLTALKSLGLAVSDCVGILVTHEHSDHVSGLDTFLKKHPVPLYGCADTLDTLASRGTIPPAVEAIPVDGQTLEIGSFTVTSFPTSHDVPCCGYRIRTPGGRVMAFATDLGYLTPVVQDNLMGCDLVALEANYDAFSLHGGPYPYYLKVRIASDRGHLDNKACAAEILDLIQDGCKKFALCHLSQTNNSPELVMTTVYNVLLAAGIHATQFCPELPIRPKKGHLAITDRGSAAVRHQLVELGYVKNAHQTEGTSVAFNLQPRSTGQWLLGSSRQFDTLDPAIDNAVLARMLRRAIEYVPSLAERNAIRTWTGFRAATPDGLPIIGRHPKHEHLWLAVGHEGLGVTTAPATASLIAARMLGTAAPIDPAPYAATRFVQERTL